MVHTCGCAEFLREVLAPVVEISEERTALYLHVARRCRIKTGPGKGHKFKKNMWRQAYWQINPGVEL